MFKAAVLSAVSALVVACGASPSPAQKTPDAPSIQGESALPSDVGLDAKQKPRPKPAPAKPRPKTRNVTIQGTLHASSGALLAGDRVRVRELGKTAAVGWAGKYKLSVTIPVATASLTLCASSYGYFESCQAAAVTKASATLNFALARNPAIDLTPPPPAGGVGTSPSGPSTCTTSGPFTNCNDGSTCTTSGVFSNCSSGVTCTHSGVFTNCSNGVMCTTSGVFTTCSDGSTCTTSGVFTNCSGAFHPTGL